MAIAENASIEFFGTQDDIGNTSSAVASAAFSVTADLTSWTNDDDAPMASITLDGAFTTAPTAGEAILLYCRPMNVESTNDNPVPDASYKGMLLGSFLVDAVGASTSQWVTIDVRLPNYMTSSVYEFYIENLTSQSLNSGWTLHVTPKTVGPHPA